MLVTVTATAGTTAPVGSVTEPVIVEVPICAGTKTAPKTRMPARRRNIGVRICPLFQTALPESLWWLRPPVLTPLEGGRAMRGAAKNVSNLRSPQATVGWIVLPVLCDVNKGKSTFFPGFRAFLPAPHRGHPSLTRNLPAARRDQPVPLSPRAPRRVTAPAGRSRRQATES